MRDQKGTEGYGKPPKNKRWAKGTSGNPAGRPVKPPPTWAQIIEKEWMSVVTLLNGQKKTSLELMLLHVQNGLTRGERLALRCKRKFETLFRKKMRMAYDTDYLDREISAADNRHRVHEPGPNDPLSENERKYRAWQEEVAMIMPKGMELSALPLSQAIKLMGVLKRAPECPMSRDRWRRRRSKKLADTEIFDLVQNSPVLLRQGERRIRVPRMDGTIKRLVVDGAKGDMKCIEMLLDLHGHSTRDGDFGIPKRTRK